MSKSKDKARRIVDLLGNSLIIIVCVVVAIFLLVRLIYAVHAADWRYVVWLGIAVAIGLIVVLVRNWLKKEEK